MLNRVEKELPSKSDVAKVDDKELQEITENAARSRKISSSNSRGYHKSRKHYPCVNYKAWTNSSEALGAHSKSRWQKRLSDNKALSEKSLSSRKSETIQNTTKGFEKKSGNELNVIMMT